MDKDTKVYLFEPEDPPKGWKQDMGILVWDGDDLYINHLAAGMTPEEASIVCAYHGSKMFLHGEVVLISEELAREVRPDWGEVFDKVRIRAVEIREREELP